MNFITNEEQVSPDLARARKRVKRSSAAVCSSVKTLSRLVGEHISSNPNPRAWEHKNGRVVA